MRKNRLNVQDIALCGLLLSMMLVMGWVEHLLPSTSIPGVKLGLSNGVLIFAVYMLGRPTAWLLMVLKVTLSALFFGAGTFPYAMAGGVLSMLGMTLLSKASWAHPITVSLVGGVLHNVGQVSMAMLMLNTPGLMYYMAVLMVVGMVCGAVTGVCADRVMAHMKHTGWKRGR